MTNEKWLRCHKKKTLSDLLTKEQDHDCSLCPIGRMKANCQKNISYEEIIDGKFNKGTQQETTED
jgi:hypothetical protein